MKPKSLNTDISQLQQKLLELIETLNKHIRLKGNLGNKSQVIQRLRELVLSGSDCDLIFYWGVFYDKEGLESELALIAYIEAIVQAISSTLGILVNVHIVLTDRHAALNEIPAETSDRYFDKVRLAMPEKWNILLLSSLVGDNQILEEYSTLEGFDRVHEILNTQAKKLHGDSEKAIRLSLKYFHYNLLEAAAVQKKWPGGIFLHSGVPEISVILPSLPVMYIYSGFNKQAKKPWFKKS